MVISAFFYSFSSSLFLVFSLLFSSFFPFFVPFASFPHPVLLLFSFSCPYWLLFPRVPLPAHLLLCSSHFPALPPKPIPLRYAPPQALSPSWPSIAAPRKMPSRLPLDMRNFGLTASCNSSMSLARVWKKKKKIPQAVSHREPWTLPCPHPF